MMTAFNPETMKGSFAPPQDPVATSILSLKVWERPALRSVDFILTTTSFVRSLAPAVRP